MVRGDVWEVCGGRSREVLGVWGSVLGCGRCGKVCWGVGKVRGDVRRGVGKGKGRCGKVCWGVGKVRGDVRRGVRKGKGRCGKVLMGCVGCGEV